MTEKVNDNYLVLLKATSTGMLCKDEQPCQEYGNSQELTLPLPKKIQPHGTSFTKLELHLEKPHLDWVSHQSAVIIYLPRFVHQRTTILQDIQNKSLVGYGADLYTTLDKDQLLESAKIEMIIDHQKLPWFGPADFPIFLTNSRGLASIQDLRSNLLSRSLLTRQVQVVIPILVLIISLLFYHSRVFVYLGIFAAVIALRTTLAHNLDVSGSSFFASFTYIATNLGASLLPPMICLSLLTGLFTKMDHIWLRSHFFSLIIGLGVAYYFGYIIESADLISDGFAGLFTLFVMTRIKAYKNSSLPRDKKLALGIVAIVSMLTFIMNSYELANLIGSNLKPWFLYNFNLLLPGYLIGTFIYKGFVLTQIINYFKKQKRMDAVNQNLETATKFQKSILPERKHVSQRVSWRTFFKPSLVVSGDWFFIENLQFSDYKQQTFAIIIDVAGKGGHASMLSTYLAGEAHNYLKQRTQAAAPLSMDEKSHFFEALISSLRSRLFTNNPYFDFSMAAVLIDYEGNRLSYVSCGHPGLMHIQKGISYYLPPTGSRINNKHDKVNVSHLEINQNCQLIMLSDGLIPESVSTPLFLQKSYNKSVRNNRSYLMQLVEQYKMEWKSKRQAGAKVDDAACIAIHIGTLAANEN